MLHEKRIHFSIGESQNGPAPLLGEGEGKALQRFSSDWEMIEETVFVEEGLERGDDDCRLAPIKGGENGVAWGCDNRRRWDNIFAGGVVNSSKGTVDCWCYAFGPSVLAPKYCHIRESRLNQFKAPYLEGWRCFLHKGAFRTSGYWFTWPTAELGD